MRRLAAVLCAVLALWILGTPGQVLASHDAVLDVDPPPGWPPEAPWPAISEPPMTGPPAFVYWIRELVDRVVESLTPAELPDPDEIFNPPQFPQFPPPVCFAAVVTTEGEARCDVQINEVGDARTGRSFTTTASANFCRQEPSGEECVGTTQSVGRTGAEADPRVGQESGPVALPQACVGSTCTPPGALSNAPRKVTVFNAGTTPEASVYTGTGAVNANAPQACVSIDDSCTGTGTSGTTKSAGLENVSATQLVTTQ